jgi:hypothetical protein
LDLATEARKGFGKLKGMKIRPTQEAVELIQKHLAKFGDDAPNKAMLERIKNGLAAGRLLEGADAHFYAHEFVEQGVMNELMQGEHYTFNEAYKVAHQYTLDLYRASPYSLYHIDVVNANLESFNPNWVKFWELMK